MGHEDVFVLDGGLPKWKREGRPIEDLPPRPFPRHFTPRPNNAIIRDFAQVAHGRDTQSALIVDARSHSRFLGKEIEPRPGVRPGHIPGSLNIPYTELTGSDGTLKSVAELRDVFGTHGVNLTRPMITT